MYKKILFNLFTEFFYDILFIIIGIELIYILLTMWGEINVSYIRYNSIRYQFYYWYHDDEYEMIL